MVEEEPLECSLWDTGNCMPAGEAVLAQGVQVICRNIAKLRNLCPQKNQHLSP
jgi:hypothetical protein